MKKLTVLAALLLATVSGFAAPVTIVFTSFNEGLWQLGYPYTAAVDGVAGVTVMCDDWAHGGEPGQTWQANVTNLGSGDLSLLRFNQVPNAPVLYDEVGWLALQAQNATPDQRPDINSAVWFIFDSAAQLTPGAPYWLDLAQEEALAGFPGVNFNEISIYTPVNQYGVDAQGNLDPNAPQELLRPAPEPATLALLAGGLLGLWGRRKLC